MIVVSFYHDEARRGGRAEVDRGGAGEARAGDRHRVPPAAGPLVGLMPVTVGAAAAAWVSTTSSPSPPT